MTFVVAIDGPAGTGKSSVARFLAHQLNFIYVDTGAIYRALAFLVEKDKVDADNVDAVVALISRIEVCFDEVIHSTRIKIDGEIVENELRTEHISRLSSLVSQHGKVREALLPVQRSLISKISLGAIFEGRDIGTVVFPFAPIKLFITANPQTRAKRRYEEIKKIHETISFDEVLQAIEKRDERDKSRANAPMQQAEDAHVIDTSMMTFEQVTKEAISLIEERQAKGTQGNRLW
jgi:cytidylate kinase